MLLAETNYAKDHTHVVFESLGKGRVAYSIVNSPPWKRNGQQTNASGVADGVGGRGKTYCEDSK